MTSTWSEPGQSIILSPPGDNTVNCYSHLPMQSDQSAAVHRLRYQYCNMQFSFQLEGVDSPLTKVFSHQMRHILIQHACHNFFFH